MDEINLDNLTSILSSPDLIKNVQNVISQLSDSQPNKKDIIIENESGGLELEDLTKILKNNNVMSSLTSFLSQNKNERIALLSALKPFLSIEKQAVIDTILQILKIANVLLITNTLK